jgi:hypothetical protein
VPTIASDILDEARGTYLNDPLAGTYTNDKLLPHLKTSYNLLQSALEENGVQCKNEEETKIIPANTNEYDPLPISLVIPKKIQERKSGSTDEFRDMDYCNNIPQTTPETFLTYWTWRTDRIFFLPATEDREAKLFFQKSFPTINTPDIQMFGRAEQFLAAKVAAFAHAFLSQNLELAKAADDIAKSELETVINMSVRLMQTAPASRKPYLPMRRR